MQGVGAFAAFTAAGALVGCPAVVTTGSWVFVVALKRWSAAEMRACAFPAAGLVRGCEGFPLARALCTACTASLQHSPPHVPSPHGHSPGLQPPPLPPLQVHAVVRGHQIIRITLTVANVPWWSATRYCPATLQCRLSFRLCSTPETIDSVDVLYGPCAPTALELRAVVGGNNVVVAVTSCWSQGGHNKGATLMNFSQLNRRLRPRMRE